MVGVGLWVVRYKVIKPTGTLIEKPVDNPKGRYTVVDYSGKTLNYFELSQVHHAGRKQPSRADLSLPS